VPRYGFLALGDPVANHSRWAKDIEETQGHAVNYPMIGDPN
jgi:alkyl hydroperoxide reductase subunit AhpC